jgi:hypothetical protein
MLGEGMGRKAQELAGGGGKRLRRRGDELEKVFRSFFLVLCGPNWQPSPGDGLPGQKNAALLAG